MTDLGLVTRTASHLDWEPFDRATYEVKDVAGRRRDPVAGATSMVACFGDTAAGERDPSLVPVDEEGRPATAERPYFDWGFVCPSADAYRERLLELVEECAATTPDLRLDDVGFPRGEYCRCERCEARFAAADGDDWLAWRASVVTAFVAAVRERVPGRLALTVHPDPYPGRLRRRAGVDLEALAPAVDEVVVPLYDTAYGTTYWLEALAGGFGDRLDALDAEVALGVELYAADVEVDALAHAAEVARAAADVVYFGYGADTARAAVRRLAADANQGVEHGP